MEKDFLRKQRAQKCKWNEQTNKANMLFPQTSKSFLRDILYTIEILCWLYQSFTTVFCSVFGTNLTLPIMKSRKSTHLFVANTAQPFIRPLIKQAQVFKKSWAFLQSKLFPICSNTHLTGI